MRTNLANAWLFNAWYRTMTSDLSWKSEAPSTRDSIITALSRFTLHKMSLYCPLLHRLLGLDLLLSLKSVHVTLEEVAVGQLELVDILSVDDGRNFLVLVDCSHEAHVLCWSWVRRRGWRYLGILQQNYSNSVFMVNEVLTNFFAFFPFPVVGLCFGIGFVLPSYLFIQILRET